MSGVLEELIESANKAQLVHLQAQIERRLDGMPEVWTVGDEVRWSGKKNPNGRGEITKVNRTKCLVKDENTGVIWTIPMSMLVRI